jgi:MFS-type transporter involved in bile tolerance (Atg22 family)
MIFFHLGWLYDVTGSYNMSFYGIGTVLVVGGVLLSFIPVVQNLSRKEPSLSSSTSRE